MSNPKHIIVGTAGHIDHGKTELIKALTGTDADRLKEEKERGITIDIGFAFLSVGQTRFGFVDVPGHERFVKNMLAGVHGIDMVMLVVAADESIMPQTREHFDICRLLKVKSGLVAITKIDLADEEFIDLVEQEVEDYVSGSFLDGAPIIRLSSRTGEGLDQLKVALAERATHIQEKRPNTIPRLPIDRVFSKRGFGTVVTGTLVSGSLREGQSVEILPRPQRSIIRGLQVHNESTAVAQAGERTAINLQGLGVDELERGDVIVATDRFRATSMIDARLELLPTAPQPLRNRARVRFHLGTAEILSRIILLDSAEIAPGASALVQFRLERPTFALPGDRFIIRRYSPQVTIGGGVVVDAQPLKHRIYRPDSVNSGTVIEQLKQLEAGDRAARLGVWVAAAGRQGISQRELASRSGLADQDLNHLLAELIERKTIIEILSTPRSFVSSQTFSLLKSETQQLLAQFHQSNPLLEGMSREEVRTRLLPGTKSEFSAAFLSHLIRESEFKAAKDWVRLATHEVKLSPQETRIQRDLLATLKESGYQAPTLSQVAEKLDLDLKLVRKLFQLLMTEGRVIRLGEFLFDADLIRTLMQQLRDRKAIDQKLDVASFKELIQVTRKYAIPLLEYLDRQGVTRRVGNERIIL